MKKIHRHDMAIDSAGRTLPFSAEEVRAHVEKMLDEGELVAVISRVDDQLGMHVFGAPSQDLADTLDAVANAYRVLLRGH